MKITQLYEVIRNLHSGEKPRNLRRQLLAMPRGVKHQRGNESKTTWIVFSYTFYLSRGPAKPKMHCFSVHEVAYLVISQRIKLSSYHNGRLFAWLWFLLLFLCQSAFLPMKSMNGECATEIVHITSQTADVDPVLDIESAEGIQSNHVPGSPNFNDNSTSDGNVLRPWLRVNGSNLYYINFSDVSREIQVLASVRRRFILVVEDRQIINCIVNYLGSIADSFARAQTHSIVRLWLSLMVKIPAAYDYLKAEVHTGLFLFASLLDMMLQIRE